VTALDLDLAPGAYAICRLKAEEQVPEWATRGAFVSVTRTPTELSVVCAFDTVPRGTACEGPWRLLVVRGPLDFALTGILASMASPLADAGVSIFAISTHDTDYVLVPAADVDRAVEALRSAGHRVFE
jgi:uncharacterized protein